MAPEGNPKKRRRFKARAGTHKKPRHDGAGSSDATKSETNQTLPESAPASNQAATLEHDMLAYIVRIHSEVTTMLAHGDAGPANGPDEEPSTLLARNALGELCPRLHEVALHPQASRVLQMLIEQARDETLLVALHSVVSLGADRVLELSQNRNASHVLQALIGAISALPDSVAVIQTMGGLVEVVKSWDLAALRSMMDDPSGSYVARAIFAALTGIPPEEPRKWLMDDSSPVRIEPYLAGAKHTPIDLHAGVLHCAQLILDDVDSKNMPWVTSSSASLQALLAATTVADPVLAKRLMKHVMGGELGNLVYDASGSRFVERVITCFGAVAVWDYMRPNLTEMVQHAHANFVVQRVLMRLKGRGMVKAAWDILEQKIPELMRWTSARQGVVLALLRGTEAEGGALLQKRASNCVAKALGATGTNAKHFVGAVLSGSMETWLEWREKTENGGLKRVGIKGDAGDVLRCAPGKIRFNVMNVLIARCLLRYQNVAGQVARESMATFTELELIALAGDASCSRLLEQWVALDMKNARRMTLALLDAEPSAVLGTAKSAYGAQLLSKCVPLVPMDEQKRVMDELAAKMNELKVHRFGEIVIRKCRVETYARDAQQWFAAGSAQATRSRLFADILNDTIDTSSGKKGGKSKKQRGKEKA